MRLSALALARYRWRMLLGWWQRLQVPARVRLLSGPPNPPLAPGDAVAVALVRNGAAHVEPFLQHHLALGVRHVVLLDNGSTDTTVAQAERCDRVTILSTTLPYRTHKYALKRYLVDRFGARCWCLLLDIDELFAFPACDRISLASFLRYLDGRGFTAVVGQLLDLFAEGTAAAWPAGVELPERCRCYDHTALETEPYEGSLFRNRVANPAIRFHHGGLRRRAFGVDAFLTKHPLLRRGGGALPSLTSSHYCYGARLADVSCALLHFKFDHDFPRRCREAVRAGSYFAGSAEYLAYRHWLDATAEPRLDGKGCRRLDSLQQLVDEGFLAVSQDYLDYVRGAATGAPAAANPAGVTRSRE